MATKAKAKTASKRTKVKNLPKSTKELSGKSMKKVRGGDDLTQTQPVSKIIPKATLYGRKAGDDGRMDY